MEAATTRQTRCTILARPTWICSTLSAFRTTRPSCTTLLVAVAPWFPIWSKYNLLRMKNKKTRPVTNMGPSSEPDEVSRGCEALEALVLLQRTNMTTIVQNSNEPYLDFVTNMLNLPDDKHPQTLTTSYGEPEQTVPKAFNLKVCQMFGQLGARGVSVLFSSGE